MFVLLSHRRNGQALVEFTLVLPVFLLMAMIILDLGRVTFAYASVSNSIRFASRNAVVIGVEDAIYDDCTKIIETASQNIFIQNNITVTWVDDEGVYTASCTVDTDPGDLSWVSNNDILKIENVAVVSFFNPFTAGLVKDYTMNFTAQRTIITAIPVDEDAMTADSDRDGMDDEWETNYLENLDTDGLDDPDGDTCNNVCEYMNDTDPVDQDSDDDGLSDYDEIKVYFTDPNDSDSDDDGLLDGEEKDIGLDVSSSDSDNDGLLDGEEILGIAQSGTTFTPSDATKSDTDEDGLTDYEEVYGETSSGVEFTPSDPNLIDTDGDGLGDKEEVVGQLTDDPLINFTPTNPRIADSDLDGLDDLEEVLGQTKDTTPVSFTPTLPLVMDSDLDGLTDYEEVYGQTLSSVSFTGSNPLLEDTDGDGMSDIQEVLIYSTNPTIFDEDADDTGPDGINDFWERLYFLGSDIENVPSTSDDVDSANDLSPDPDNDGCDNLCEFENGLYPVSGNYDGDVGDNPTGTPPGNDAPDYDHDGLLDGQEVHGISYIGDDETTLVHPNAKRVDTDEDGLTDYEEVSGFLFNSNLIFTDPTSADSDGDGLADKTELEGISNGLMIVFSNPRSTDTDGDTLSDEDEVLLYQTDPNDYDTDNDLLSDPGELLSYATSPFEADTDGDLCADNEEVLTYHTNANNNLSAPDTDGDGLNDCEELQGKVQDSPLNFMPTQIDNEDSDGDLCTDYDEVVIYYTDPNEIRDFNTVCIATQSPNLSISLSDLTTTYTAGQTITYTINITNVGTLDASDAIVIDIFPSSLQNIIWSCVASVGSNCTANGLGNINDTVTLLVNGTLTYSVTAQVSSNKTGILSNTAGIATISTQTDSDLTNNSSTDTNTAMPVSDLALVIANGYSTYNLGDTVNYTFTVTNSGPSDAFDVTVTDSFPSGLSSISWSCVASNGGNCATHGIGDINDTVQIPSGGMLTYNVSAVAPLSGNATLTHTASATVATDAVDSNTSNNYDSDSKTLAPIDLAVSSMVPSSGSIRKNTEQTIVINLSSSGTSTASNISVTIYITDYKANTFTDLSSLNPTGIQGGGTGSGNKTYTATYLVSVPTNGFSFLFKTQFEAAGTGTIAVTVMDATSSDSNDSATSSYTITNN